MLAERIQGCPSEPRNSPVARRRDEIEHGVHAVVSESRVTLDSGFRRKYALVLPFHVPNDLGEAVYTSAHGMHTKSEKAYQASLSIWSPKPGVSIMVREMR